MTGTSRTDHVLDAIDGALHDYHLSGDAMRWTPDPAPPRPTRIELTPEQAERIASVMAGVITESVRRVVDAMRPIAQAVIAAGTRLNELGQRLQALQVVDAPAPLDPRERALHARRTRNTGPAPRIVGAPPPRHLGPRPAPRRR